MWGERQDTYQAPQFRSAPELSPEARRALQFLRAWAQTSSEPFSLGVLEPLFSRDVLDRVAEQLCHFNYLVPVGGSGYELRNVQSRLSAAR